MEASDEKALQERANELYWSSDESVNQIADELDLSKGALYGLVEPLPSGVPCPRCDAVMVYPNRTARSKGYLSCPACGLEEDEEVVRSGMDDAGPDAGAVAGASGSDTGAPGGEPAGRDALNRMLLGSALLGAAAGVILTLWARRK